MADNSLDEFVQCSVFGETFKLRCSKKEKLLLQLAADAIEKRCAARIVDSPYLSPVQAAILVALDAQRELIGYQNSKNDLSTQANSLIDKMENTLKRHLND